MKKIILLTISAFLLSYNPCFGQGTVITTKGSLRLSVHNICQAYGLLAVCNGDSSNGIHPSMGYMGCDTTMYDNYYHIDSLLLFNNIKFVETDQEGYGPWANRFICIGDENLILSYMQVSGNCSPPGITPVDTLISDSIADMVVANEKIFVIRRTSLTDNLIVYDSVFSSISYSTTLNYTPLFIATDYYKISIAGINNLNQITFTVIDLFNMNTLVDTILGPELSNPYALFARYNNFVLSSSPGDTAIYAFYYSSIGSQTNHIYSGSGPHSFGNREIIFQPETDTTGNNFDKQLFFGGGPIPVIINQRISHILNPSPDAAFFGYTMLVPDSQPWTTVYYYDSQIIDTFYSAPNMIWAYLDWRCPVKVEEYDDSHVEWEIYPNPTSENASLIASGLICGRTYQIDIIDMNGKILFQKEIHAKMNVTLPLENFPKGIYFARIHTLKGMVIQKIVKS